MQPVEAAGLSEPYQGSWARCSEFWSNWTCRRCITPVLIDICRDIDKIFVSAATRGRGPVRALTVPRELLASQTTCVNFGLDFLWLLLVMDLLYIVAYLYKN